VHKAAGRGAGADQLFVLQLPAFRRIFRPPLFAAKEKEVGFTKILGGLKNLYQGK
jgi:hypothetical protein